MKDSLTRIIIRTSVIAAITAGSGELIKPATAAGEDAQDEYTLYLPLVMKAEDDPVLPPTPEPTATQIPTLTATPEPTPSSTQTPTPEATITPESTATPEPAPDLRTVFEQMGIEVNLPNPEWPTTYAEVAEVLAASDPERAIQPDQVVAVVNKDEQGSYTKWDGWFMIEAFPLKEGVSYNAERGYHEDADSNPLFDPIEIFNTQEYEFQPEDLVDARLNSEGIALFARRGNIAREENQPPHTHYFIGSPNVEITGVEQLSLIPVPEDLCPDDRVRAASTIAYRQAAAEFRDNPHARDGVVTVKWHNPETTAVQTLDGRMISALTEAGYNLPFIDYLPPNYPISPEQIANLIGGNPQNWVVSPETGGYWFEAFHFKPGVRYEPGVGHRDRAGRLLVGAEQADRDTSDVFAFDRLNRNALLQQMWAPGNNSPAGLFARSGMAPYNPNNRAHSIYTWGRGDITIFSEQAIEQAWLGIIHTSAGCPRDELPNVLADWAQEQATQHKREFPDNNTFWWNGSELVEVQATQYQ